MYRFLSMSLLLLLLCPLFCLVDSLDENLLDESRDEDTLLSFFNDVYIRSAKDDYAKLVSMGSEMSVLHNLGLLGIYFRIFKRYVPVIHKQGQMHLFPEPAVDFDVDLAETCKTGLVKCINYIYNFYTKTHPWLFAKPNTNSRTFERNYKGSTFFQSVINDNQLAFETTALQLLCFFTNSEISAFQFIPFCAFDLQKSNDDNIEIFAGQVKGDYFDEIIGAPFECSAKSFCPDPCCHGVAEILRDTKPFTALCRQNSCNATDWNRCVLEPNKNSNLIGIRKNDWNATCPCDSKAEIFRADIGQCVVHNPCQKGNLCEVNEICVNVYGGKGINDGYKCICQLGYIKKDSACEPINLNLPSWYGLAHSEPRQQGSAHGSSPHLPVFIALAAVVLLFRRQRFY